VAAWVWLWPWSGHNRRESSGVAAPYCLYPLARLPGIEIILSLATAAICGNHGNNHDKGRFLTTNLESTQTSQRILMVHATLNAVQAVSRAGQNLPDKTEIARSGLISRNQVDLPGR
jgi:hypothetical protein